MSRRRRWPARHPMQATLLVLTGVGAANRWPTQSATALVLTALAMGAWWWARAALRARTQPAPYTLRRGHLDMRPVGVYQHFFTNAQHVYVGITNDYPARCAQHAESSWWWAYVDPTRSLLQTFTADDCAPGWTPRQMAKALESRLITTYAPIGNTEENPLYGPQTPIRAQLQAAIGWTPPPPADRPGRRLSWRTA